MKKRFPVISLTILVVIVVGCLCCEAVMTKDPAYMDLANGNVAPCRDFLFGTDAMGRDIFSMIWYGGRISLFIGVLATVISTVTAVFVGSVSGYAPSWADSAIMRLTDIVLSIPGLLLTVFLQAAFGGTGVLRLAVVIGLTGWMSMTKVVRTEVLQLKNTDYVLAARCLGGGFFHILRRHLIPDLIPSVLFMVVMNVRNAIVAESTLSFMGIGLPVEVLSWGSMLSLSENALITRSWWTVLFPGVFLAVTLLCLTNLGNYLRKSGSKRHSNL